MVYEILNKSGKVVNTVVADEAYMKANYADGSYRLAATPAPEPGPTPKHISVGAFFDRFGAHKYPILSSTDLGVKALIQDCSVRKYIDLDNPDLPAGLQMLIAAGFDVDADAILNAEIQQNELP